MTTKCKHPNCTNTAKKCKQFCSLHFHEPPEPSSNVETISPQSATVQPTAVFFVPWEIYNQQCVLNVQLRNENLCLHQRIEALLKQQQ